VNRMKPDRSRVNKTGHLDLLPTRDPSAGRIVRRFFMPLSAGARLGPYAILAPLGAGGMGEVYRARDSKLDRDVAIRVLPQALAQDPERLARFEREAKILASLNHPNIAQIYGIEQGALPRRRR
jgi:serine/threonine protein kinase